VITELTKRSAGGPFDFAQGKVHPPLREMF